MAYEREEAHQNLDVLDKGNSLNRRFTCAFTETYMNRSWSVKALLNCSCVGALPVIPCHPSSLQTTTIIFIVYLINDNN